MTEILLLTDSAKNKWTRLHRKRCSVASSASHAKWRLNHPELTKQRDSKNRYSRGGKPMSINTHCSSYLGVHVAERLLSHIYENVTRMPYGFKGYDFICRKGHTIDVKSACIGKNRNRWMFNINQNKIAEFFLWLVFDSRNDLNPQYIWLIPGNIVNNLTAIDIYNSPKIIAKWSQYEQSDKLEKLVACCTTIKQGDTS